MEHRNRRSAMTIEWSQGYQFLERYLERFMQHEEQRSVCALPACGLYG
jgi:hypothetical protein